MDKRSKRARIIRLRAWIAAIPRRLARADLTIGSTVYTIAMLVQLFQEELDAILAIDVADAAKKRAVVVERNVKQRNRKLNRHFENWLHAVFTGDAKVLSDFSLKPEKERNVPIQTKADAAAKGTATRKRRTEAVKKARKKAGG